MENSNLTTVFSELFTAPIQAVVQAEAQYRRIWCDWLVSLQALLTKRGQLTAEQEAAFIQSQLELAPIMRLEARIDVGISLRVTSVRQTQVGGSFGLQVSVLQAAGSFSFASQDTQESVLNARATYALANTQQLSLKDFLEKAILPMEKIEHLEPAIKFLKPEPAK